MFSTHSPSSSAVFEYVIRAHRLRGAAVIYLINRQKMIQGIVDAGTQVPSSDLSQDFETLIAS